MVMIAVSIMGGSCATSELAANRENVPTREELQKILDARAEQLEQPEQLPPQAVDRLHVLLTDMTAVLVRFRRFEVPFSFLMLAMYTAVAMVALRALQFAPNSPQRLSLVALLALPARVANAAIDIAADRALIPLIRSAFEELVGVIEREGTANATAAQYEAAMRALADVVEWSLIGWDALTTLAVCVLFTYAWRYFQRPEVIDWFESRAPAQ